MTDLFDFWSQIERGAHIHPADVKIFDRMDADRHGFQLNCLPGCFAGKLKTAPIVLLFLSPVLPLPTLMMPIRKMAKITAFEVGKVTNHFVIMVQGGLGLQAGQNHSATMKRSKTNSHSSISAHTTRRM